MDRKINKEVIEKLVEKQCADNDDIDFVDLIDDALEINVYDDLVYVFTRAEIPIPSDITTLSGKVHLDTFQIPPYLRSEHFAIWIHKFNRVLEKIGLSAWRYADIEVNIQFSNERKTDSYGSLTISELKKIIRETWGTSKEIEEILSKINNKEDCRNVGSPFLRKVLRQLPKKHSPCSFAAMIGNVRYVL